MNKKIRGVLVWLIATLFVVYSFCLNTAAAVFSAPIKASLHATDFTVALATGAFILGFACMQIPAGYLLDKFNARFVVSGGILLLALGNTIISFSDNLLIFSLSNFVQGLGASFAFIAAAVLISQWFRAKSFPVLFGLTQTISCISAGIIHYYFTLALEVYSWNDIYHVLAVFGFALFVLSILIVKTPATYKRGRPLSLAKSLAVVLKNKQLWLCTIAAAASFGVLLAYASFWYAPIQQFYQVANTQAVIVSGMIFFGIGIGTPLLGYLSNRAKSRVKIIHLSLVLGTMALLLGIYLPHYDIQTLAIIKVVSFLIGFLLSGSMLFYTIASELSKDNTRGVAISMVNTAVFLVNTLLLFLPYIFVTVFSTQFFTNLWILPICILFAVLLVSFVKDTYSK